MPPSLESEESRVLVVCPPGKQRDRLHQLAATVPAEVSPAADCEEARRLTAAVPHPDVVLGVPTLPDGNWECIHRALVEHCEAANLIVVASGPAGHLKEELEARGVFGFLPRRYDEKKGRKLVRDAWREGRACRISQRLPVVQA